MKKFINENHKVDYIFGDLTDIPISKSTQSDLTWSFIKVIMKMSFEVLNPKGKFMTHVSTFKFAFIDEYIKINNVD